MKINIGIAVIVVVIVSYNAGKGYPIPKMKKETVFSGGNPFPYAHVCSLAENDNGDILAYYHAGDGEGAPNEKVYVSVRKAASQVWSNPILVLQEDVCVQNPVIYLGDNKIFRLMYHVGGGKGGRCSTHNWKGMFASSFDGINFVNHTKLPMYFYGSVKNNCHKLSNGKVLCPSSTEAIFHVGIWQSHFETTDDDFSFFEKSNDLEFFRGNGSHLCQGIIQPTFFEVPGQNGVIRALFRSSCGVLAMATSYDFGKTWPTWANNSGIVNPGAGVDQILMKNTDLGVILAMNNSPDHRYPLSLMYSFDGENYTFLTDVEQGPGSLAYPYLIQSKFDPKKAYMCYTISTDGGRNGNNFRFVELDFN